MNHQNGFQGFIGVCWPPFAELGQLEDLNTNRITRILTTDFPQYFAIVSRIRQEVHVVGPEGATVNSTVVRQVGRGGHGLQMTSIQFCICLMTGSSRFPSRRPTEEDQSRPPGKYV